MNRPASFNEFPKLQFSDYILRDTILPFIPVWLKPNVFTTIRLLLTPIVAWCMLRERFALGLLIFIIAFSTDFIDGALARTRNQITDFGKLYDPIADKTLICSLALVLVWSHVSRWITVAIVLFEIVFIGAGLVRRSRGVIVQANRWGKIKMITQVLGVLAVMIGVLDHNPSWFMAAWWMFLLSLFFACLSLCTHGI